MKELPNLKQWYEYFLGNKDSYAIIDWQADRLITGSEKSIIASSIAKFQLGEHSEGTNLMKFAEQYAQLHDDEYLKKITLMFVREE